MFICLGRNDKDFGASFEWIGNVNSINLKIFPTYGGI